MGRTVGANADETRRRLLRAAADVFAARGYDGTRVADIARAAGLSNSALHCYVTSRTDLPLGRRSASPSGPNRSPSSSGTVRPTGALDVALPPRAVAHFCLAPAAGATLIGPDLHAVDDEEWTELLVRVVTSLEPVHTGDEIGIRT